MEEKKQLDIDGGILEDYCFAEHCNHCRHLFFGDRGVILLGEIAL